MATLEDTVRSVVQDFINNATLFTALDVSNAVKQQVPNARHREVRDEVRSMFTTDIESQGWAKTPITVSLADGTTAEALLYHPLTDSWDLDNLDKYSAQQRSATSYRPVAAAQATVAAAQAAASAVSTLPAPASVPSPATVPAPLPRDQWAALFQTTPSLFPKR